MSAPHQSETSPITTATTIRMAEALRWREGGLKYRQIAEKMGCSPSTAYDLVARGLELLNDQAAETAGQIKTIELNRLDEMWMELERKKDQSPRVIEAKIKVMEHRAKLTGIYAPVTIGGPDGGPIPIAITDARETLRARVMQVSARIAAGASPGEAVEGVLRDVATAAAAQEEVVEAIIEPAPHQNGDTPHA